MGIDGIFEFERGEVFDGEFDATFAGVSIPDAVIEAELDFLFDVPGEVIRSNPGGMDIKGGFASVAVFVDESELAGVPCIAVFGSHEASLSGAGDGLESTAEGEVDEFDVVDGDVGTGVSSGYPFGELGAGDLAGFEERAVAIVDVLEDVIGDECSEFFVVRIEEFVIDDACENLVAFGDTGEFIELLEGEDGGFFDEEVDAGFEYGFGGIEVSVIRCGNAGEVKVVLEHIGDCRVSDEAVERGDDAGGLFLVGGSTSAGFGGDSGELNGDVTEGAVIDASIGGLFEEGAVGVFEDHAHADHAGFERVGGDGHGMGCGGVRFVDQELGLNCQLSGTRPSFRTTTMPSRTTIGTPGISQFGEGASAATMRALRPMQTFLSRRAPSM